jgi:hypothetical protein
MASSSTSFKASKSTKSGKFKPSRPHKRAEGVYERVWDDGPYTSFDMIQYLIGKCQIRGSNNQPLGQATMEDFLRGPRLLESISAEELSTDILDPNGLHPLFARRTGLCTSFAIKVVHTLKKEAPAGTHEFAFYDIGWHRVARCKKTKIVIDSSAREPRLLADGNRLQVRQIRFSCNNSELEFQNERDTQVCRCNLYWTLAFAASATTRVRTVRYIRKQGFSIKLYHAS